LGLAVWAQAAELKACRLKGVGHDALCGVLKRPLDPTQPQGLAIDIHFAVLPALARNKKPDPVFFFAGGPGQSAIDLTGPMSAQFARFSNRRDLVFVDQRGTGRSAPLKCFQAGEALQPLAAALDTGRQIERLQQCRQRLVGLPYGDLRQFTTTIAVADIDAVRRALGVERINAVGASYGTRVVLEYVRQFPSAIRRAVIDGVAPPDMVLPVASSADNQAALDGLVAWCGADKVCAARHPRLGEQWRALLDSMPREVVLTHPLNGAQEKLTLTRDGVLGMVRAALYLPTLAAGLPQAIADASFGRYEPLVGLSSALGATDEGLAAGMHFSVVCAEDVPLQERSPQRQRGDFGQAFADLYANVCASWPRGDVPAAFYTIDRARGATLVLSGGADPATPPRHGQRVAQALGPKARHAVIANAGHGTLALPCLRDAVYRFVDAASDDEALKVDADCALELPRPPVFVPVQARAVDELGAAR
jgi:pimeloyl-ACP methyl ester carboxylesterase